MLTLNLFSQDEEVEEDQFASILKAGMFAGQVTFPIQIMFVS
jgi:hypothetical protein